MANLYKISRLRSLNFSNETITIKMYHLSDIRFVYCCYSDYQQSFILEYGLSREHSTHLLCKGEYNCMADLLFDCFGFDQTCKSLSNSTQAKQLSTVTGSIWIHYSLHWCWGCLLYFILSVHTKAFARVWQQKTEVLR